MKCNNFNHTNSLSKHKFISLGSTLCIFILNKVSDLGAKVKDILKSKNNITEYAN